MAGPRLKWRRDVNSRLLCANMTFLFAIRAQVAVCQHAWYSPIDEVEKKSIFSRPFPCAKKTWAVHVERESCFTSYGHGGRTNKNNPRDPGSLREVCRKLIDLVTCVPTKKPIDDFCFSRWNVIHVWENRSSWVYSRSRTGRSLIDNARKGWPEFRKTKRKRASATLLALKAVHLFFALLPPFPSSLPFRLFRTSILPRASLSFFLHPPFLSVSPRLSTDS